MSNKEDKGNGKMLPIMSYTGVVLLVIGTILGFCNIGNFGIVLGILIAVYLTWIICCIVIDGIKPEWGEGKQIIVGLLLAIFIVGNLIMVGYSIK